VSVGVVSCTVLPVMNVRHWLCGTQLSILYSCGEVMEVMVQNAVLWTLQFSLGYICRVLCMQICQGISSKNNNIYLFHISVYFIM
jgi:hypothetical protein